MKWTITLLLAWMSLINVASAEMLQKLGWVRSSQELQQFHYAQDLETIYGQLNHNLVWLNPRDSSALETRLKVLHLAQISPEFSELYLGIERAKDDARFYRFELLSTDALIRYLSYADLAVDNAQIWFHGEPVESTLPALSDDQMSALMTAIHQGTLVGLIESSDPSLGIYQHAMPVIDSLVEDAQWQQQQRPFTQSLKLEHTIDDPELLYRLLAANGVALDPLLAINAEYNLEWEAAIKRFQHLKGIEVDGIVGPKTRYWLNYPLQEKARILALNIERSRGYATQKDAYIQVSLPQYTIKFWADNDLQFSSRVIVGKKTRPTPLMRTTLDTIVVNPIWNIPTKIMRKDVIPKLVRDSNYLADRNISIIPYWGSKQVIDSYSIDWATVNPNQFNYRMTQKSGPLNALGRYKFQIVNKRAIYMHDTPAKGLFNKDERTFSSGCVRVEHADDFAKQLMVVQGQRTQALYSERSNLHVRMPSRVEVEFIYRSAWVEDGQLHMRKDIYGYDEVSEQMTLAYQTVQ